MQNKEKASPRLRHIEVVLLWCHCKEEEKESGEHGVEVLGLFPLLREGRMSRE